MDGPLRPDPPNSAPIPCELCRKSVPVSITSNSEFRSNSPARIEARPAASSCSSQASYSLKVLGASMLLTTW